MLAPVLLPSVLLLHVDSYLLCDDRLDKYDENMT